MFRIALPVHCEMYHAVVVEQEAGWGHRAILRLFRK
jgi:hypothetical protein